MSGLIVIDLLSSLMFLAGAFLVLGHGVLRRQLARLRGRQELTATFDDDVPAEHDGMASVFRMFGVMLMAFSFTICAFANLISYYSAASPNV